MSTTPASTTQRPIIVLKFGGSVLRDQQDLLKAVKETETWIDRGWNVLAVVSAFEGVTDTLVKQAKSYGSSPQPEGHALLAATGELSSCSHLALALHRAGVQATVAPPWAIGLFAESDTANPLDAHPATLDTSALRTLLETNRALVIPGFIALDDHERLVLLGRGGSDLSAIFIADAVGAGKCRLVKDVDGLYEWDPAATVDGDPPRRYQSLPWATALTLDGGIVQHKAVRFAQSKRLKFEVGTYHSKHPTLVGDVPLVFAASDAVVSV